MPKFIKSNTIIEINRHGIETDRQVLFSEDEVITRVLLNPSLLLEVTESHAAGVVRPQGRYQEVSDDTLALIDEKRKNYYDTEGEDDKREPTDSEAENEVEVEEVYPDDDDTDSEDAPLSFDGFKNK